MLLKAIMKRLRPLDMIEKIKNTDTIKNAEQLQRHLITFVAANIPNYWMRIMRPEVTEKAAIYAKARITSSIETIYNFAATPNDRADLARVLPDQVMR